MMAHVREWPSEGGGSIGRPSGRVETTCRGPSPARSLRPHKHLRAAGAPPDRPAADMLPATGNLLYPSGLGASDSSPRARSGGFGSWRAFLQELRVERQQTLNKHVPPECREPLNVVDEATSP
jgi:hypothetical protein